MTWGIKKEIVAVNSLNFKMLSKAQKENSYKKDGTEYLRRWETIISNKTYEAQFFCWPQASNPVCIVHAILMNIFSFHGLPCLQRTFGSWANKYHENWIWEKRVCWTNQSYTETQKKSLAYQGKIRDPILHGKGDL